MSGIARKLDNSPNARKLLDSLRYLGYDNLYAISDLVDNSIDSGARQVKITIEPASKGDWIIQIGDDGQGMTESVLDQASRLGSDTERNPATDLGRFGMGLVTASLSLGRRLTIITRAPGGPLLTNITDVDHMSEANQFIKEYFGPARDEEIELFEEALGDAPSGTVVRISKADGFKRKYIKAFEPNLAKHLGRVYRMFIRASSESAGGEAAGCKFYINSAEVEINDPLWLDHEATEVYSDDTYDLSYLNTEGQEVQDTVQIRLVVLPDHGSRKLNEKAGYNIKRLGFYVLRNNREIAESQLLNLASLSRHPDFFRFRGELFVSGRLDEALGIEFTKRDVKPIQSISDQIDTLIGGNIKSIRARLKKKAIKAETETLDHSSSERLIDSKAALLIKPSPGRTDEPRPEDSQTPNGNPTRLGTVKFRSASFGREGPLYAGEQRGRTTFVDWNIDHPFYERFVLANRDNKEALNAVDAMIFSMAAAELKVFDEDNREFVDTWKAIFSSNLRTLLS
ncbi:MAG TPA: ATP-binding protein [Pyrinomonadaceae bacterium]|nr:ATP-binding protein [Pyrinomonadaceae bacterium]